MIIRRLLYHCNIIFLNRIWKVVMNITIIFWVMKGKSYKGEIERERSSCKSVYKDLVFEGLIIL